MRRMVAVVTFYVFLFGFLQASPVGDPPKQKAFLRHLFGPRGVIFAGISTAIQHARDVPAEWGSGLAGLSRRYASAVGQHLVNASVHFGVAKALHEDLKYYPSETPGFGPRVKHALVSTVWVRKTNRESQAPAISRFSGALAGGFVSKTWQPARFHTFASGMSSAGISLAVDAGVNVLREFWPEIRHPRQRLNEVRAQALAPAPEPAETETEAEIEVIDLGAEECTECNPAKISS
jgi:hypothetical protein